MSSELDTAVNPLERPLTGSHWVCGECVTESELQRRVRTEGVPGWCNVCGRNGARVTLDELASWIDPVYRQMYQPGPYIPCFPKYGGDRPDYEQEGDSPSWILQGLVGIDVELAEALVSILSDRDWTAFRDGEDSYYDEGASYTKIDSPSTFYYDLWCTFEQRIKHGRRFHDEEAISLLNEMFAELETLAADSGQPHIKVLSPGDAEARLYRARLAQNADEADEFGRSPAIHLAPPPADKRSGGRLNAPGIAVFYGAFDPETCIAEIRPPVGSWLVVAAFEPTRELRLLDLTAFSNSPPAGSPFASGHIDAVERWRFLRTFHSIVSTPVLPHEEALRYVTTQVVAEYTENVLKLDGLIYASAQMGGVAVPEDEDEPPEVLSQDRCNVALFSAQECIELGAKDGVQPSDAAPVSPAWMNPSFGLESLVPAKRAPTLRYVDGTALVHHVAAVTYATHAQSPRPEPQSLDSAQLDF